MWHSWRGLSIENWSDIATATPGLVDLPQTRKRWLRYRDISELSDFSAAEPPVVGLVDRIVRLQRMFLRSLDEGDLSQYGTREDNTAAITQLEEAFRRGQRLNPDDFGSVTDSNSRLDRLELMVLDTKDIELEEFDT